MPQHPDPTQRAKAIAQTLASGGTIGAEDASFWQQIEPDSQKMLMQQFGQGAPPTFGSSVLEELGITGAMNLGKGLASDVGGMLRGDMSAPTLRGIAQNPGFQSGGLPGLIGRSIAESSVGNARGAVESARKGNFGQAALRGAGAVAPLALPAAGTLGTGAAMALGTLGPTIGAASEDIEQGNLGSAAGRAVGALAPDVIPGVARLRGAGAAPGGGVRRLREAGVEPLPGDSFPLKLLERATPSAGQIARRRAADADALVNQVAERAAQQVSDIRGPRALIGQQVQGAVEGARVRAQEVFDQRYANLRSAEGAGQPVVSTEPLKTIAQQARQELDSLVESGLSPVQVAQERRLIDGILNARDQISFVEAQRLRSRMLGIGRMSPNEVFAGQLQGLGKRFSKTADDLMVEAARRVGGEEMASEVRQIGKDFAEFRQEFDSGLLKRILTTDQPEKITQFIASQGQEQVRSMLSKLTAPERKMLEARMFEDILEQGLTTQRTAGGSELAEGVERTIFGQERRVSGTQTETLSPKAIRRGQQQLQKFGVYDEVFSSETKQALEDIIEAAEIVNPGAADTAGLVAGILNGQLFIGTPAALFWNPAAALGTAATIIGGTKGAALAMTNPRILRGVRKTAQAIASNNVQAASAAARRTAAEYQRWLQQPENQQALGQLQQ